MSSNKSTTPAASVTGPTSPSAAAEPAYESQAKYGDGVVPGFASAQAFRDHCKEEAQAICDAMNSPDADWTEPDPGATVDGKPLNWPEGEDEHCAGPHDAPPAGSTRPTLKIPPGMTVVRDGRGTSFGLGGGVTRTKTDRTQENWRISWVGSSGQRCYSPSFKTRTEVETFFTRHKFQLIEGAEVVPVQSVVSSTAESEKDS